MKFAFSTNAYTNGRYTIEDAIRRIAKSGYAGATILADKPLVWVPEITQSQIRSIKQVLQETGLQASSVNGFTAAGYYGDLKTAPGQKFGPIFSDADPKMRAWKVVYTKKVVDLAHELGTRDVSIGSGYPPQGVDRETAWNQMREAIEECVAYAEKKDVRLNIEYEPDLLVGGEEDAARILKEIPSPNFGLNFDIGHSFVCGENVVDQIRRFRDRIHAADFEDMGVDEKGNRVHAHMVPGEGVMPLEEILRTFLDVGYDGWHVVELYNHFRHPAKVTNESMRYLRKIEKKLEVC